MESLKIPYGVDEFGELVSAESARSGSSYNCPSCDVQLIRRAGDLRAKHFAHPPASNCSLESALHITAKKLVHDAIMQNAQDGKDISLANCCQNCGVEFLKTLPPKTFSSAALEVGVGEYVCDVVGYRDKNIGLAIEVVNTHEVGAKKAAGLDVYWIELKAEDVINNPKKWIPTQANLKASYCESCKNHLKHVVEVANRYGIERSLYSPLRNSRDSKFIADTEICFKCKKEIPVFWWEGVPFCEVEPPSPRPKTIKYRKSKQYGGSYWANTCANCNMIQGDNYLFIFDGAPFQGMPLSNGAQASRSGVKIVTGSSAVSEFMKVINRNH